MRCISFNNCLFVWYSNPFHVIVYVLINNNIHYKVTYVAISHCFSNRRVLRSSRS